MFTEFLNKKQLPAFRVKQLHKQYYFQSVASFDDLTNWPEALRSELKIAIPFVPLELKQLFPSKTGKTYKALFTRLNDDKVLESVLMRHRDGRNTVCVSCMIGCPVGCLFCATGKLGFKANLTAHEIVEQVLFFQRKLNSEQKRVSNVVFMGMGEPLLNLPEVLKAVRILTDPDKFALSDRRIAISTSGYIPQLKELMSSDYRGRLAVSLHAPNQELRTQLMPMANYNKLPDLMKVLDEYVELRNKRIFYEYLLISGVNDSEEHALELSDLLKGRLAHVNLIPFNPIAFASYKSSNDNAVIRFKNILLQDRISVSIRGTFGADIEGACGQLAGKTQKK